MTTNHTPKQLTVDQTDLLINEANLTNGNHAIEDTEVADDVVCYFLENGVTGTVDRRSGEVTFA